MALVHRTVTARVLAANRLNALRHGMRSAIATDYFFLWLGLLVRGPWEPPPPYDPSQMPIPIRIGPEADPRRRQELRAYVLSIAPYVRPLPRPAKALERSALGKRREEAWEKRAIKNRFFYDPCHEVAENKGPRAKPTHRLGPNEPISPRLKPGTNPGRGLPRARTRSHPIQIGRLPGN